MRDTLQPSDHDPMARGQVRWQVMIRRARKHLVSEGWLDKGRGSLWTTSDAGRQATGKSRLLGTNIDA